MQLHTDCIQYLNKFVPTLFGLKMHNLIFHVMGLIIWDSVIIKLILHGLHFQIIIGDSILISRFYENEFNENFFSYIKTTGMLNLSYAISF